MDERTVEDQLPSYRKAARRFRPRGDAHVLSSAVDRARLRAEDGHVRLAVQKVDLRGKAAGVRDVVRVLTRDEGAARQRQPAVERPGQPDVHLVADEPNPRVVTRPD